MEEKQFEYECATCGMKFYRPFHKSCKYCSDSCRKVGIKANEHRHREKVKEQRNKKRERDITNFILKAKADGMTYEQAQIKESLEMMWEKGE